MMLIDFKPKLHQPFFGEGNWRKFLMLIYAQQNNICWVGCSSLINKITYSEMCSWNHF